MNNLPNSVSRSAHLGAAVAAAAVAMAVLGVGGAATGVLPAFGGFLFLVLGLGSALIALITSIVGIVATAPSKNREGRGAAIGGVLLSMAVVVGAMVGASPGNGLPRINDITTDLADPPVFVVALEAEPNKARDMAYPGPEFADQQLAAYPDLASVVIEAEPPAAFDLVYQVLAAMPRTTITGSSLEEGRVEATETSAIFRFSDDVVVRIRPYADGGSRIDVRSKSRDGKGDLGVNAARIRTLIERIRAIAPPPTAAPES